MAVRYPDTSRYAPDGQPLPRPRFITLPQEGQPWPGLTRPDSFSRWFIPDAGADELINYIPFSGLRALPANGANAGTLPGGTAIWMVAHILNGGVYNYVLSTNGHLYQVSVAGAVVDVSTTTALSANCDMTIWQGTIALINDPVAQKVYSWDGTTFTTVFSSQPVQYLAVYSSRLWMSYNSSITFTAGGTYNSLAGDAGNFIITDEDCANPIIHLMSLAGQLWIFGSNWIQVLSNLNDIGTPAVLSFTKYVLESQVSIVNRFGIIPYGTSVYFPTAYGIYTIQGTQPIDVSEQVGGFFQNLDPANSSWSGAYGVIYGQPVLLWHVKWTGETGTTVLGLNIATGQWFRSGGGATTTTFISGMVSSAITNSVPTVWGTDGTHVFQLFVNTSVPVTTQFNSKIWNFGNPIRRDQVKSFALFVVLTTQATFTVGLTDMSGNVLMTIGPTTITPSSFNLINSTGGILILKNNSGGTLTLIGSGTTVMYPFQFDTPYTQRMAGINVQITSIGHVLCFICIELEETEMYFGD